MTSQQHNHPELRGARRPRSRSREVSTVTPRTFRGVSEAL